MIAIIDYGMGNVGSIANMIKKAGGESKFAKSPKELYNAKGIVLPGVGSFDNGMNRIKELGLIDAIKNIASDKRTPIIGICLGMQLMTYSSDEGKEKGLGLIDARTLKFDLSSEYKVPHMGWNYINNKKETQINKDFDNKYKYYFVHSYYVKCENKEDVLFTTNYGTDFCSAFQKDNIIGVQFHPEKSHNYGVNLFKNFWEML